MADLAPRPRGGWQVGSYRKRQHGQVGPYGPDNPDPAPDVYSVHYEPDGGIVVRHFAHVDAEQACRCGPLEVTPAPGETVEAALARGEREMFARPCHRKYHTRRDHVSRTA